MEFTEDLLDYSKDLRFIIRRKAKRLHEVNLWGSDPLHSLLKKAVPLPSPQGRCIVKTRHGYLMIVDPRQHIGAKVFSGGSYEEGVLQLMNDILSEGDVVVDVGAHAGMISLHAASVLNGSGHVIAFEPSGKHYASLVKAIQLNNFQNISAVQAALGSEPARHDVYLEDPGNDATYTLQQLEGKKALFTTEVYRLDTYLQQRGISSFDWLKIDAEGFEVEVLEGAREVLSGADAPGCIIEYNESSRLLSFMQNVNEYSTYRFHPSKFVPAKLVPFDVNDSIPPYENLVFLLPKHVEELPQQLFA